MKRYRIEAAMRFPPWHQLGRYPLPDLGQALAQSNIMREPSVIDLTDILDQRDRDYCIDVP